MGVDGRRAGLAPASGKDARAGPRRARHRPVDAGRFIARHTRLLPVPTVPEIRLHTAHEATGLWRLAEPDMDGSEPPPPYWAFPWAGGLALARYLLDHPDAVRGRRVLDLGTGSGIVGIAAGLAGATAVLASDIDRFAVAATRLNASANGVTVRAVLADLTGGLPPEVDVVLVGDLFYERDLAARVTRFLDRCRSAGMDVIVGDPERTYLPAARLRRIAGYAVPDVGDVEAAGAKRSGVFAFL